MAQYHLTRLCRAAEKGDSEAQRNLDVMYCLGKGVPQDDHEDTKSLRLATAQTEPTWGNSALMYNLGESVPQYHKQTAEWYRCAAKRDSAAAQYNKNIIDYQ